MILTINNENDEEQRADNGERTARIAAAQLDAHALRAFVKLLDFNEQLKNEILPILAQREADFNLDYRIQTWINNAQEELEKFIETARFEYKKLKRQRANEQEK